MTVEERIEKLESELERTRGRTRLAQKLVGGIAVVIVLVTMASLTRTQAVAQSSGRKKVADEIRARRFVLLDENGKTRGLWKVLKEGPQLILFDEKGKGRAALAVSKAGPGLTLADEKGEPRIAMGLHKGVPRIVLADDQANPRIGLSVERGLAGDTAYQDKVTEVGRAFQTAYEKGIASQDAVEAKAVLGLLQESRLIRVENNLYLMPKEIGDDMIEQYRKMGLMP